MVVHDTLWRPILLTKHIQWNLALLEPFSRHPKSRAPKLTPKCRNQELGTSRWCYDTAVMNLVLVHGILGFRQKFGVEYFRGVAEHFRAQGFAVLVPELDSTRGIEFRGNQ